jgi:hypothetical protein
MVNSDTAAQQALHVMLAREHLTGRKEGPGQPTPKPLGPITQGIRDLALEAGRGFSVHGSDKLAQVIAGGMAGARNLGLQAQGKTPTYGMSDAMEAERQLDTARMGKFEAAHPALATGAEIAGGAVNPAFAGAGEFIGGSEGAVGPLATLMRGKAWPMRALRSVVPGGLFGAATGALDASPGQTAQGALHGAKQGAMTAPLAVLGAGTAGRGLKYGGKFVKAVGRMANQAAGEPFTSPNAKAINEIRSAAISDGATPEQATRFQNHALKNGLDATLLDFADSLESGGPHLKQLITGATQTGMKARGAAGVYRRNLGTTLQQRALDRTRGLAPDVTPNVPQTAADLQQGIRDATQPPVTVRPGSAGKAVSAKLNADYDTARKATTDAYKAAQASKGQAMLSGETAADLKANMRSAMEPFKVGPISRAPGVAEQVANINELAAPREMPIPDDAGLGPDAVATAPSPIDPIYAMRERLSHIERTEAGTPEAAAATAVRRAVDQTFSDALDNGHIIGDPEAVQNWRDAIAARRYQGQKFEGGDLMADIVNRDWRGGAKTTTMAPEDVSTAMYGGRTGVGGRPNQVRDLSRIRDYLGADHPIWQGVQDEATHRLLDPHAGTDKYGLNLDKLVQDNPDLADVLTPDAHRTSVADAQGQVQQIQAQQDALKLGGQAADAPRSQYGFDYGNVAPEDQPLVQQGALGNLQDRIAGSKRGSVGQLNELGSIGSGENLGLTFGDEAAGPYQDWTRGATRQLQLAQLADPTFGSQTSFRGEAGKAPEFSRPPITGHGLLSTVVHQGIDTLNKAQLLTEAEKAALAQHFFNSDASNDLAQYAGKPVSPGIADYLRNLTSATAAPAAAVAGQGGHYEPSGVSAGIEGRPDTFGQSVKWVPDDPNAPPPA